MSQYVYSMFRVSKIVPPQKTIIKDISLSFLPGAKIGLLGLNGAGKSTVCVLWRAWTKNLKVKPCR